MLVEFWKRHELKLRRFIHNSLLNLNKAFSGFNWRDDSSICIRNQRFSVQNIKTNAPAASARCKTPPKGTKMNIVPP